MSGTIDDMCTKRASRFPDALRRCHFHTRGAPACRLFRPSPSAAVVGHMYPVHITCCQVTLMLPFAAVPRGYG